MEIHNDNNEPMGSRKGSRIFEKGQLGVLNQWKGEGKVYIILCDVDG